MALADYLGQKVEESTPMLSLTVLKNPLSSPMLIDLNTSSTVFNPSIEQLIQDCIQNDECRVTASGAVVAYSGKYTGRTPKDKLTVRDSETEADIWWENNHDLSPDQFAILREKVRAYADGKSMYVIDTFAGADPDHRIAVRFIVERAYHAMFIKQLLIRPSEEELKTFSPDWTVVDVGKLSFDPATDPTRGDAVIALNFSDRQVLIAGTQYAGEMKKSVFTIMNYLLPKEGVLSMHCSANIGPSGDTALFFGLSGTGKTTLSADPERRLIGDDEHGWSGNGVFNVEGGCYAKCISLSEAREPEIFHAIRTGAILENVVVHEDGTPDYDDGRLTENTRAAYPIHHIPNAVHPSVGGHPQNIVFLTADAMGVLPPISRLTPEQAMYYFLNGYTAKVAGTEAGVTEPQVVFSTCFGAPFLPLRPRVYADLLKEKITQHHARVWLVNTGWTGGPYGVGSRMKLAYTRAMIRAAFHGDLDSVEYQTDSIFGLNIPVTCPEVPGELLNPRQTWADPEAYDARAHHLRDLFEANYRAYV